MLPHPQSVAKTGSTLPALQRERQAEKLSFYQPNRQSKLEMFQQEVEELFFLHCYVMVGSDCWCAFHILCPAVPFKAAPALECFLPNISSTICFPIRRAALRLVAHCLPCRENFS